MTGSAENTEDSDKISQGFALKTLYSLLFENWAFAKNKI